MATKFFQANLWNQITALAKKAKRKYVAVAYLGKDATKLLPLDDGDVLVTDCRIETVREGLVNPFEIETYLEQGVEVHSIACLHAKVFIFDDTVIIGSANVSARSRDTLIECAVSTNNAAVVQSTRGFVLSLMGAPVTPAYVKSLKKEYRAPKFEGSRNVEKKGVTFSHPKLWIERIDPGEFDDKENRLSKAGKQVAAKRVKDKRKYSVEVVRYGGNSGLGKRATIGDLVIQLQLEEETNTIQVYPPSRIVNIKRYVNVNGAQRTLVFTEESKEPQLLDWRHFRNTLLKWNVPKVSDQMGREIKNSELKNHLLGMWVSQHAQQ